MTVTTPASLAGQAAEAVRDLNHATQLSKGELVYLGDVYEVIGQLSQLAHRLPQSFTQLAAFLDVLTDSGGITADYGTPEAHLTEARTRLASCALTIQALSAHLDRAHQAIAPLGYDTTDDEDEQPCGEGMCQCYCIGHLHPCGCDCPHDDDCDCDFCATEDEL